MTTAKWSAMPHAIKRARERFAVKGTDTHVKDWIANLIDKGTYVGIIPDDDGKMRRVYTSGKAVVFVALADNAAVTVRQATVHTEWKAAVMKMAERELRKANRKALAKERELVGLRSQMETEVCELRFAALGARSSAKRNACNARINALTVRITELDRDINRVRRDVLKAAESFSAVI